MYCLAVIMCQSCTSGMWGRVPGRLVWSRRLVCVYLTVLHSCVLSKCNRRRPHPSERGILPFFLLLASYSCLLRSPPPFFFFFVQVPPLRKCQQTGKRSRHRSNQWIAVLAQLFSFLKRVCISQGVAHEQVMQAQHMKGEWNWLCLWQHRCNLSESYFLNTNTASKYIMTYPMPERMFHVVNLRGPVSECNLIFSISLQVQVCQSWKHCVRILCCVKTDLSSLGKEK